MAKFIGTPQEFVSELTYRNYAFNRGHAPEIQPAEWRRVFPEFTEAMEARYQQDVMKPVEIV